MRWMFQFFFHQIGGCDQFMSTFGYDNAIYPSAYVEQFVTSIAFNPFLPTISSTTPADYGVALHLAVDIISLYMDWNTCAIFMSDGGSNMNVSPAEISLFLMIKNQMADQYQTCLCAICVSVHGYPIDPAFEKTCLKIGANIIANPNPWAAGYTLWNHAAQRIYGMPCNCQ